MRSQLLGLVNFTQKSTVKGDSSSDITGRDTQFICKQNKSFHSARSCLPSSGKYKVLGLNRDFLTNILTVCNEPMDILSLFAACS